MTNIFSVKSIIGGLLIILLLLAILSFSSEFDRKKKPRKGNLAPEIELPTITGDTIKLSDYRGSMVILDFWASWCKGCRVASHSLLQIQSEYSQSCFKGGEKGLFVYSVSLDSDKERWINAIEKDSTNSFINVSDLKGMKSEVALTYGIGGLPMGYLIDGNGIIVSDFRELRAKLNELSLPKE